jgi:hypothetical protein
MRKSKYYQRFLVAVCFCLTAYGVMAQKTLSIKPSFGWVFPLSTIEQPSSSLQLSQSILFSPQLGGALELDPGKRWRFSVGGYYSGYGMSYKESRFAQSDRGDMLRVPLGAHYSFADNIRVLNLDRTRYAYLLLFRLYAIAGLDFNYATTQVSSWVSNGNLATTDSVITVQQEAGKGSRNLAAGIGFGIQFFDRADHDRLDISFYCSRGLGLLAYQNILYHTRNEHIRLLSRGSLVGVNLSYPIRFNL